MKVIFSSIVVDVCDGYIALRKMIIIFIKIETSYT